MMEGTSNLPVKLNPSGVIPPIFASSLLLLTDYRKYFQWQSNKSISCRHLLAYFGPGQPLYLLFFVADDRILSPISTQQTSLLKLKMLQTTLKNQNGFIPGIRPGQKTAEYLDYVVNRILVDWCWLFSSCMSCYQKYYVHNLQSLFILEEHQF